MGVMKETPSNLFVNGGIVDDVAQHVGPPVIGAEAAGLLEAAQPQIVIEVFWAYLFILIIQVVHCH
jgi:hypothetical protein